MQINNLEIFNSVTLIVMVLFVVLLPFYIGKLEKAGKFVGFTLIFVIPYMAINYVQPAWKDRIKQQVNEANYCARDKDCFKMDGGYYDIFCGEEPYVNEKEIENINKDIRLYGSVMPNFGEKCTAEKNTVPICMKGKCESLRFGY